MKMQYEIQILRGDITEADTEAVENAANTDLLLGAGVAGAIKRKGGPVIQAECDRIGPISLGEATLTTGGQLKAKYVIHAASMSLGGQTTAENLAAATRNSLLRAEEKGIRSIAFPAIGTGVAGFEIQRCAEIMLRTVREHVRPQSSIKRIIFVLFDDHSREVFERTWRRFAG